MLLSIALLTKNSEDTVRYAIRSLYIQDIPKDVAFELIVVDGYSKDNTLKIVYEEVQRVQRKFQDKFTRFILLQEKVGVGYARNLALKEAHGDWILWLDSDNILAQDYVIEAVKKIKEVESCNVAVLYPKRVVPIRKGESLAARLIVCYHISQSSLESQHRGEKENQLFKRLIGIESIQAILPYTAMQGTLCNVKVLRGIGGFNPYLIAAEDVDLFLRLISSGYRMEPFNSTLYSFCRNRLRDWFKQAVTWGYGGEIVKTISRLKIASPGSKGLTKVLEKIYSLAIHTLVMIISSSKRAAHLCGVRESLFMPFAYIYRRIGYIKGSLCALGRHQEISHILQRHLQAIKR